MPGRVLSLLYCCHQSANVSYEASAGAALASDRVNQKVEPAPGALSTPSCPSCRSMIVAPVCLGQRLRVRFCLFALAYQLLSLCLAEGFHKLFALAGPHRKGR